MNELDREIAIEVMGWTKTHLSNNYPNSYEPKHIIWKDSRGEYVHGHTPKYSTSMSDAWLVVERMRELKYKAVFYIKEKGYEYGEHHEVVFDSFHNNNSNFGIAHHDSMPIAICEAALQAIKESKDG